MNEFSNYEKLESKKPVIFGIKITWLTVNVRFEQIKRLFEKQNGKNIKR